MIFVSFTFHIYKKYSLKVDANVRPHKARIRRHLLIERDTRQIHISPFIDATGIKHTDQ